MAFSSSGLHLLLRLMLGPLAPGFTKLQPQQPSFCFWWITSSFMPQDLCTCCSICLGFSSLSTTPPPSFQRKNAHIQVSAQVSHQPTESPTLPTLSITLFQLTSRHSLPSFYSLLPPVYFSLFESTLFICLFDCAKSCGMRALLIVACRI